MTNLTRAEIESMTPAELNRAIAEAKGWRLINYSPQHNAPECYNVWVDAQGIAKKNYMWDPSGDIRAAWELVEEIGSNSSVINIQVDHTGHVAYVRKYPTTENDLICEHAPTAPLAICRVWLLWKST